MRTTAGDVLRTFDTLRSISVQIQHNRNLIRMLGLDVLGVHGTSVVFPSVCCNVRLTLNIGYQY